jgi:hypothetical protein
MELSLAYAPLDVLELSVEVPALSRTVRARRLASEVVLVPGDVELRATGTLYRAREKNGRQLLALTGGVKLPTAPDERDLAGVSLSSVLQPGCNAVTPNLGVAYALAEERWGFSASASFYMPIAVREAPHQGDSIRSTLVFEVTPTRWFAGRLGIATRFEPSAELRPGVTDPNSGGLVGSTIVEIVVRPTRSLSLSGAVYSPVVQLLRGDQRLGNTFSTTVSTSF